MKTTSIIFTFVSVAFVCAWGLKSKSKTLLFIDIPTWMAGAKPTKHYAGYTKYDVSIGRGSWFNVGKLQYIPGTNRVATVP